MDNFSLSQKTQVEIAQMAIDMLEHRENQYVLSVEKVENEPNSVVLHIKEGKPIKIVGLLAQKILSGKVPE